MRVVSVAQMRDLERATFAQGVSEDELQRRAASAVAGLVAERWPQPAAVVALVGTGNNGRDAWIAAELLLERGWKASLYLCPGHSIAPAELEVFEARGGRLHGCDPDHVDTSLAAALEGASLVLDGLLGLGARGAPRPPLDAVVAALNQRRSSDRSLRVVAVDIPSGLDPDRGEAPGPAVTADATVVLGGLKRGLLTTAAACWTGELWPSDIGVVDGPPEAAEVLTRASLAGALPRRPMDAHKGSFGRLLVVSGSERYVGAAYLVCAAAVRAGTGIVTLAAPHWLRDVVASRLPEATYLPLPDGGPAQDPHGCLARISEGLHGFDALAIGPGLSTDGGVPEFVVSLLQDARAANLPMVVDADALNVLAGKSGWPAGLGSTTVITPHAGELARLLAGPIPTDEPPWDLAGRLSSEWPMVVVLKGAFTSIGWAGAAWVHPRPNPGLATAGTGDVLTGIVGGLLARGVEAPLAARLAVWAHGAAAAHLTRGLDAGGSAASDLLGEIPRTLAQVVAA